MQRSQKEPLNWSRIPLPRVLLLASPSVLPSTPLPLPSPSNLLRSPSNPSPVSAFFSPTTQPGTLNLLQAPGPHSPLHATPTIHPTAAANAEPGNDDRASWPASRYVKDLSLKTNPLTSPERDVGEAASEVTMRYL